MRLEIPTSKQAITIVTVAGPGDEEYIKENAELINNLNPSSFVNYIVINNGGIHNDITERCYENLKLRVLDGVPLDISKPAACRGSYQHSEALNSFFYSGRILTQYVLILDPDFYLVAEDCIKNVIEYMRTNDLAFLGVPWHPKWFTKYRNFPCVHCMFIDTQQVDLNLLNFAPDLLMRNKIKDRRKQKKELSEFLSTNNEQNGPVQLESKWWLLLGYMIFINIKALAQGYRESQLNVPLGLRMLSKFIHEQTMLYARIKLIRKLIISLTISRRNINAANDTGFLVYKKFYKSGLGIGLAQPVVRFSNDFSSPIHLRFKIGRLIESFVPDRWSYVPKKRNYYLEKGFENYGLPNVKKYEWEEFLWMNKPFGFHLRRYNKVKRDVCFELSEIRRVIKAVYSKPICNGS